MVVVANAFVDQWGDEHSVAVTTAKELAAATGWDATTRVFEAARPSLRVYEDISKTCESKAKPVTVRSIILRFERMASAGERVRILVGEAAEKRLDVGTNGSNTAVVEAEAREMAQVFEILRAGIVAAATRAAAAAREHPLASPGEADVLDHFATAAVQACCRIDWSEMKCNVAVPAQPSIVGCPRGMQVIVTGMKTRPDFNGKVGTIVGFEAARGRYQVTMESDRALLKDVNLQLLSLQ